MPSNWPKTWLKRKQIEKTQGMENALVAAIPLDFFFDRLQIGQQVAVREHHAPWFCRGSRGKYDLYRIVAVKHRLHEVCRRAGRLTDIFESDGRERQIQRRQAACRHQHAHTRLLRDTPGKSLVRNRVHGNDERAAKNAAEKSSNPFPGVFSPKENAITFCNTM